MCVLSPGGPQRPSTRWVPKLPVVYRGRQTALGQAELVVGAAGDGVVSLPRIVRALEHAQTLDELGNDEMRVGVAVAVEVSALVDGDAADREFDVLSLARVEAAHEDLLGVALAAFVGQQDSGRELQQLGRVRARDVGQLIDAQLEVGHAAAGRGPTAEHADVESRGSARDGRRGKRALGGRRRLRAAVAARRETVSPARGPRVRKRAGGSK